MENLIVYIEQCLNDAKRYPQYAVGCFTRAFGALSYHITFNTNDEKHLEKLWNEKYKPEFEKIAYGV